MGSEKERKAFYELKKRMEGDMESYLCEDDNIFYRFLRARNLDVDLAEAMLRKHLEWRKQYDVENIFDFKCHEVLEKYMPANFLGYTKDGEVFRYVPSGNIDIKGVIACCPNEHVEKYLVRLYEEDLAALKKQTEKLGKLVDKVVYIHDMKGLTLSKVIDRKVLPRLISLCHMYQDNYPECLKAIFGINAPSFIGYIYNILKSVLNSEIMKKIRIYSDDSWRDDLLEIADAEVIPAFLGGKRTDPDGNPLCNTIINHGGIVPDKYYAKRTQSFSSLPDIQKVTVSRATVHEMPLDVEQINTFLEWEFKVKSGDIKFGIKYQNGKKSKTEVIPLQRITTDENTETGSYKCENVGTYTIVFDNSYSYLRSKDIYYRMQLLPPGNETR